MKILGLVIVAAALMAALTFGGHGRSALAAQSLPRSPAFSVETFVWRFSEDYPGTNADSALPLNTVYIKTNDGPDWMAKLDKNPNAVAGPDSLRQLIQNYNQQGIRTIAWFVPKGSDYQTQIENAKAVLDTGVDALYVDIEPYAGFCYKDCGALAENFWKPLRDQRPDATLGVIYDPRPRARDASSISSWLSVANTALPMCYWDDFSGQSPWDTPDGCIGQASADLPVLAPAGSHVEFVPIIPGSTDPEQVKQAITKIVSLGGRRMSLWRRGVVSSNVWNAIESSRPDPNRDIVAKLEAQLQLVQRLNEALPFPALDGLVRVIQGVLQAAQSSG